MSNFALLEYGLGYRLIKEGQFVDTKSWQAQDISERPEMTPRELIAVTIAVKIPELIDQVQAEVMPNLPWAEDHFLERVSGIPMNPPPSHERWPFARAGNAEHTVDGQFSHTYPERFWPKQAGPEHDLYNGMVSTSINRGIRFEYGDLQDVVVMLKQDLHSRQAYLPVFFPEDTGKTDVRIPCTLGYQFLVRENQVSVIYGIRSCDFLRHFRDDVYMAMRLASWMRMQLADQDNPTLTMGSLHMNIGSLHVFQGDMQLMKLRYGK